MFKHTRQGAVELIQGDVPLNLDHIAEVEELLAECEAAGQPRIVIDLDLVPLIDSTGLELLLDLRDRCLQKGGAVKLASPNNLCEEILRITGVGEKFEIYGDSVAAAGSFAQ
jgi:anti-anti-sigma factor